MDKFVNKAWTITKEKAAEYKLSLENMHAVLPQPASGSERELLVKEANGVTDTTLMYSASNGVMLFKYNITTCKDRDGALCTYSGPAKDFGYGDIGPFMGCHHNPDISFKHHAA